MLISGGPSGTVQLARSKYLPSGSHAYLGPTFTHGGRGYPEKDYGTLLIRSFERELGTESRVVYHLSIPYSNERQTRFESIHVSFYFVDAFDGRKHKLFQHDYDANDFSWVGISNSTVCGDFLRRDAASDLGLRNAADETIEKFSQKYDSARDSVRANEKRELERIKDDTPKKRERDRKENLKKSEKRHKKRRQQESVVASVIAEKQAQLARPLSFKERADIYEKHS